MDLVGFHGVGLRSGEICSLTLIRVAGPLMFATEDGELHHNEVKPRIVEARLGLVLGGREVEGVEHLFAALGGLGVRNGVQIEVRGPELPLLDGTARELALAIRALAPPREAPRLRVVQSGEVLAGESRYSFEPLESIDVAVEIEERPIGRQRASWNGNPTDFIQRVASARLYDHANPERQSVFRQARAADPNTVLVLDEQGRATPPGAQPSENELARHRLLDVLADLYLMGGPPLGRLCARQPQHGSTQHAVRQALEFGLLERR